MREEEEERLSSENICVENILQEDGDDCLARRGKIKVGMRLKINHLFKYNLEENQFKDNLIDLAKCSHNSMMKSMKIHITLNYTIVNNNVSSHCIGSIYDEVIEESLLKNKLPFVLKMKKKEQDLVIISNRRK